MRIEVPLLVGGEWSIKWRARFLLLLLAAACGAAVGWYYLAKLFPSLWPIASDGYAFYCGVAAGAVILFEMALWQRKRSRGRRLGRTRFWLRVHIYAGIAILPLGIIHSGFHLGGSLTTVLMALFVLVIFSGVYGTLLQQVLPSKMLADLTRETVASEIDEVMGQLGGETASLAASLAEKGNAGEAGHAETESGDQAADFFMGKLKPYLEKGAKACPELAARQSARVLFDRLRRSFPADKGEAITRLEGFCDQRRDADRQAVLQWRLHSWLLVHVPLSVALTVLLLVHAVSALKAW